MEIKLIAEGSTKWERFIRHWGLSFFIGEDVLFDTFGKPKTLMENIKKLNIDISKLKHIIISHEHWDHTSGLWNVLKINNKLKVYVCKNTNQKIKEKIKSYGAELIEIDGEYEIKQGLFSLGEMTKDNIMYEQSVCMKTEKGLIVITGCAHQGTLEIVHKTKQLFKEDIYAFIGGFHLKDSNLHDIIDIVGKLKHENIKYFVPLHCTGKKAVELFKSQLNCISINEI
ncbi:MAG: MBL fold metallo-hydrolase [Endomicrobiaceae bacterium]|nr:MBL fold metallo-hydrolase [Endomicrobiaceae bacterium]